MEKIREFQEKLNELENTLRTLPVVIEDDDVWTFVRGKIDTKLGELDTIYSELNTPEE